LRSREEAGAATQGLSRPSLDLNLRDWLTGARPEQLPPAAPWTTWLFLGGRGAGKTRAGAEWVRGLALGLSPFAARPVGRIALVAETLDEARAVMVEGVSGLLGLPELGPRPVYEPSRRRLAWPNGAVAQLFSAEDPDSLRGPQFEAAWCDEAAKWRRGESAWDTLQFGLRLGRPRQMVTTTPRAVPLIKRLLAEPGTVVSRARTQSNADHLAPDFLASVVARYAGTRLGRQELDGELIEDRPDTLFPRAAIEAARAESAPALRRIVVAVDPPASSGRGADAAGIVAAGEGEDGLLYVLADATLEGARPQDWARRALQLYASLEADALVAEANQGGEMVRAVLAQVDAAVPVRLVRATRGKHLRAEPISALYAQGRIRHAGRFPLLEDEMADFGPDGLSGGRSPDRLDALVWAMTALLDGRGAGPRVRMV